MRARWLPALTALALCLALGSSVAQAGRPARDALGRLRAQEPRNRLEDRSIDARRRPEAEPLGSIGTPSSQERTRRRWHAEDDRTDFRREREREALRRRVGAEKRPERGRPPRPTPGPDAASEANRLRAPFDDALRDAAERERLERLRRDAWSRSDSGVRRRPR